MKQERSARTCVGCRQSEDPDVLERFVFVEEFGVLHDVRRKAPGRGAYVHARRSCLEGAHRGGFARGFRRRVELPPLDAFIEQLVEAIARRFDETMRLAVRSHAAAIGGVAVEEAMREGEVDLLFVASDAGDATRKKLEANARRKGIHLVGRIDGANLASYSGREFVAATGIAKPLASRLVRDLAHLEELDFFEG